MEKNLQTYSLSAIVAHYASQKKLQPPEQSIFELLKERLSQMNMLDIGIGGGRTTAYFAPVVKNYTGIDYSPAMIDYCKKYFSSFPYMNIFTEDARNLSTYNPGSFDFVLCSFNGLDYMEHRERIAVIAAIYKLCSGGGMFCFSAHNLFSVPHLYKFRFRKNAVSMLGSLFNRYLLIKKNGNLQAIAGKKYAVINDGALGFRLKTYYINPLEQIRQLNEAGFDSVRIFGLTHGCELTLKEVESNIDYYLYYLCLKTT